MIYRATAVAMWAVWAALWVPSLLWSRASDGPVDRDGDTITIIVTNDVHGYVFEDSQRGRIGFARLQGEIDAAAADGRTVILMDAGDAFSGNAVAQFDAGKSVAELMGVMGYRVMAPGNHAFDYNASEDNPLYYPNQLLDRVRRHSPHEDVAVTCLNLAYHDAPAPGIDGRPVVVMEEEGFRLVVAGVLTPYTAAPANREAVAGYSFGLIRRNGEADHAATKAALLQQLETALRPYDRPGDVVVVLSHVGDDDANDQYRNGQVRGSDFARVANVDVVVDAHSHNLIPARRIGTAWYGLAGRYLENFAEITLRREGGGVEIGMEIRGYHDLTAAPSAAMLERLREVADRLALGEQLFTLPVTLDDARLHQEGVPLGRFLCRSIRDVTGADMVLLNSGSIRSPLGSGWVTAGNLYDCIPFQNNIVTLALHGREIQAVLGDRLVRDTNAFPQFDGLTVHAWDKGDGVALGVASVFDDHGEPLQPGRLYTVAMNSFIAGGGDGYRFDPAAPMRDYGDTVTTLVEYFRRRGLPEWSGRLAAENLIIHPSREAADHAVRAVTETSACSKPVR